MKVDASMQLDILCKREKVSIYENYSCNKKRISLCASFIQLLVIIFVLKIENPRIHKVESYELLHAYTKINIEIFIFSHSRIFFLKYLLNTRSKISFHREKRFRFELVPLLWHVDEWLIKVKQNGTEIVIKLFSFRETRYRGRMSAKGLTRAHLRN